MDIDVNKKYLVVGLGKTGLSCINYLTKKNADIIIADTRNNPPNFAIFRKKFPNIKYYLNTEIDSKLINEIDVLVLSPGISFKESFVKQALALKKEIIGDIELFIREAKAAVIAVTGTNGKSTVVSLIGEMAKESGFNVLIGGNIGKPALNLLEKTAPDLYLLELSSFQLQTTSSMNFNVAVLLNITEDHLDHHNSMESYTNIKFKIFQKCKTAVINKNLLNNYNLSPNIFTFDVNPPNSNREFGIIKKEQGLFLAKGSSCILQTSKLKLSGLHNLENALAALATGMAIGLDKNKMISALKKFNGLKHRCELIANFNGIKWFNDSKATNVGAAIASITGLGKEVGKKIILIAGGIGKGQDFSLLNEPINKHVAKTILFGKDKFIISKAIEKNTDISFADSLADAVKQTKLLTTEGNIVLLAPACSSFDMFKNFEDRGQEFIRCIKRYVLE